VPAVLNKSDYGYDTLRTMENVVYVGRPSKWGNPFKLPHPATPEARARVIDRYEKWVVPRIERGDLDIEELRGKDLMCWCAPEPCHADVLLRLANT
jgi:hypothetical protein